MNNYIYAFALLLLAACSAEKESYVHSLLKGDGIGDAEVSYIQEVTGIGVTGGLDLMQSTDPLLQTPLDNKDITVKHVQNGNYSISLKNEYGESIFTEIPEKFVNMDADVSFSRKVFESFFPKEWEPMRGTDYSTLYIKSKRDNQIFFMKVVQTGTNKEMAKYSEDF